MHIDRRALLFGGAAVAGGLVVGAVGDRRGWWEFDIIGAPDPDDAITRVVRGQEAVLIGAYDAALQDPALSAPPLLQRLQNYRQHHVDHLVALGGGQGDVEDAPLPGRVDAEQPEGAAPAVAALPGDAAALPAYFATAEQRHIELASTGVRISTQGELARVLALIAASETMHVAGWSHG